jgi:RNA-binding protein PNO1
VPQNRMTPLKSSWMEIYKVVTGHLKLDMRMNLKMRKVWQRCLRV